MTNQVNAVIEREILTVEDFTREFYEPNRPVIIRGAAKHVPAYESWTVQYLKDKIGARIVKMGYSESGVFNFHKGEAKVVSLPFNEALDHMSDSKPYYISQASLAETFPELAPDLEDPQWIYSRDIGRSTNVWIGGGGCVSPLHFDTSHNFLVQIVGRKKITLFPPSDSKFLYQGTRPGFFHVSEIDMNRLEQYPLFKHANTYTLTLHTGDILYIPLYWWHLVESLDMSVSVNYWWDRFELVDGISLESASGEQANSVIQSFLKAGAKIDQKNANGESMLYKAFEMGFSNFAEQLLILGADPDLECGVARLQTPRRLAVEKGMDELFAKTSSF
ncbi:cupin-like domain-containing protein [Dyadobacter sp. OTU695]|uniref:cupin-like domain-containing protein n=1 Tax=Dyadobacter sp. OTU695 TaxID=3043860 RepID=UPI00313D7ADE